MRRGGCWAGRDRWTSLLYLAGFVVFDFLYERLMLSLSALRGQPISAVKGAMHGCCEVWEKVGWRQKGKCSRTASVAG